MINQHLIDGQVMLVKGVIVDASLTDTLRKPRGKKKRTFGSIRKWFKAGVAIYVGKEKMHAQHLIQAICYNLKRMPVIEIT